MKWFPVTGVIALIVSAGFAADVSASGVIHGKLVFFPGTDVTVTLYETKWFGMSKTEVGRAISTPENREYHFAGLSEGSYRVDFRGPYIMPTWTDVDLDRYQELNLTDKYQPIPNYPAVTAILYAHVMNNPDSFPEIIKGIQPVLSLYDDLDDCLQDLGENLIARSLQMNPSEAYDHAVGLWQPGMPTNIPSDIRQNVASEAVEMIEMGRMVLAIRGLLPELTRGQSATYFSSELYDRCLGYAQVRQAAFVAIRGQYEDIYRMQKQAAAMLGSNMTIEPPAELKVFQPEVIHQLMFNFYFSQAFLYATATCR